MFHRDTLFQGGKGVATSICQNILKAIDPGTAHIITNPSRIEDIFMDEYAI